MNRCISLVNGVKLHSELAGVIDHYRTSPNQKVYLLGHSWGAILATAFTGKYPEAVQGLVLQEPGGWTWDECLNPDDFCSADIK